MQVLLDFFSLADPNVRYVVLGTLLLTSSAGIVGAFTLLKKKALVGDAIAHAVLPGVCIAFIVSGVKSPLYLILGASATGWLSLLAIDGISQYSKLKEDTAIALVLSVAFGIGMLLLTAIQHSGNAAQVGLINFLFGKAAALVGEDIKALFVLNAVIISIVFFFFKELTLLAFDKAFAQAIGLPVKLLELLLTSLTVLTIVIGIRVVGILLMTAMLITPAAAARFWTNNLTGMVFLSVVLGIVAGQIGAFISYIAPAMPTGPWIVVVSSVIAYGSFLLAPRKGLLARKISQRRHRKKTLSENILKLFYELGEPDDDFYASRHPKTLLQYRPMPTRILLKGLKRLQQQNMLQRQGACWLLTPQGQRKGEEISRLHRLWELYLTQYLKVKPDHVHEDAESIEHVMTPALAQELNLLFDVSKPVKGPERRGVK